MHAPASRTRIPSLFVAAALLLAPSARSEAPASRGPGPVVAVGGGPLAPAVYAHMLRLAGGKNARVVVFPQASKRADGSIDIGHWTEGGAKNVRAFVNLRAQRRAVLKALQKADIIWFGGGAQLRLMKALKGAKLVEAILARHRQGALVAGTSAGAAVLSEVMLSGKVKRPLRPGKQVTYRGLGLWPEVIVDQHFVVRKRFGRLFTAVLDHPSRVGLGIGESAAVLWRSHTGQLEVISNGIVVVVDARSATIRPKRSFQQATGVTVHTLTRGDRWALRTR